jgi:alkylated DNA repair protein (DNA oxidative demethylase)
MKSPSIPSNAPNLSGDLFADLPRPAEVEPIAEGAVLLRRFALAGFDKEQSAERELVRLVDEIALAAPFRNMVTPGGFRMSVAMTNCGSAGWISDRTGYRYDALDPVSGRRWP